MRVAILPFSTAEGVPDSLGRQIANFLSDTLRAMGGQAILLNLMSQVQEQPGKQAFVNLGDALMETEQMVPIYDQVQSELIMDGLLTKQGEGFHLKTRYSPKENPANQVVEERDFAVSEIFKILGELMVSAANQAMIPLPANAESGGLKFGTENAEAFMKFLEGHDALAYVRQANGAVVQEFNPARPLGLLVDSLRMDTDFEGPYQVVLELARTCAQYRIGQFVTLENALKELTTLVPDDFRAWYVLAEIHAAIGEWGEAATFYEKAIEIEPNDPALYTRLAVAQSNQGMLANAERNLRKALEREGVEKPSLDFLCQMLIQMNRGHEVPPLWKERIDANPQDASFHAKYGFSLMQNGREEEGEKVFENALATLQETFPIKRYYAPLLAQKGEVDRAMDFYEDCLDVTPADVPLMMEYAKTLEQAGREFEVPQVLRNVLSANSDPNTRAQAAAWLIELEQPKRVEAIEEARTKVEASDFEGALRDLKPLKNWMGDYWKFWAILANCYNQIGEFAEAEDAAGRLVNLMPGYEQGYAELRQSLAGQQKFDQAYNAMKWANMNMPQSLVVSLNLGLAAKQAGKTEEARGLAAQIRTALNGTEIMQQIAPMLDEIEG
jgi:Flp pilus assembly protein TadD